MKRQYCGRLGKTENCQSGVFLAFAGDNGYGLVDYELYLPKEWFGEDFALLYKECHIPEEKTFSTKNEIAVRLLNQAVHSGLVKVRWVGCDAAYGNDHASSLTGWNCRKGCGILRQQTQKSKYFVNIRRCLIRKRKGVAPESIWYCPLSRYQYVRSQRTVQSPGKLLYLQRGRKTRSLQKETILRCYACRKDGNRNYVKPGSEIWLYLRKYADGEIKYFVSNAPGRLSVQELDRAAALRWSIEQCFEECKSNLGMGHYECI